MNDGTDSLDDIGARLTLLRIWAGFDSQSAFARALDVSQTEINHYERGNRRLTLTTAQKIRARFRVTLDWLYFGDRTGLSLAVERSLPRLRDPSPDSGAGPQMSM